MPRRDPEQRFVTSDDPLADEFGGYADRGTPHEPAGPDLQDPELAGLERELDVAGVAVVRFDPTQGVEQLRPHCRLPLGEFAQWPGRRRSGDDFFSLTPEQDFAERDVLTGVGVAAEGDSGAAVAVAVAEHHPLDDHGCTQVVRDVVHLTVGSRAWRVPGREDSFDRQSQLAGRVVRNRLIASFSNEVLDCRDRLGETRFLVLGSSPGACSVDGSCAVPVRVRDRGGETRQEAQPRVQCERPVVRLGGKTCGGFGRETEVEDRAHHAGHRHAGPGANRYCQRLPRSPEGAPGGEFEVGHGRRELVVESIGKTPSPEEGATCLSGDDESGRHRQTKTVQKDQATCLAAQCLRRLLGLGGDRADPPHRCNPSVASRSSCSSAHTVWYDAVLSATYSNSPETARSRALVRRSR